MLGASLSRKAGEGRFFSVLPAGRSALLRDTRASIRFATQPPGAFSSADYRLHFVSADTLRRPWRNGKNINNRSLRSVTQVPVRGGRKARSQGAGVSGQHAKRAENWHFYALLSPVTCTLSALF
jgi:hypothetical protein